MTKLANLVAMVVIVSLGPLTFDSQLSIAQTFKAYYTKIDIGEEFEKDYRAGKYAELVVQINSNIKVYFWRGTSYLPILETPDGRFTFDEMVPRKGDGSKTMPDKQNRYSKIRLIENTPARIVVHWRYAPDLSKVGLTYYVDEYFYFYPSGIVNRSFRPGATKLDDWKSPSNLKVTTSILNNNGIKTSEISSTEKRGISQVSKGYSFAGYDAAQRCFKINTDIKAFGKPLTFTVNDGLAHPAFLIKNWGEHAIEKISIKDRTIQNIKTGYLHTLAGTDLIISISENIRNNSLVTITPKHVDIPVVNQAPIVDAGKDQSIIIEDNDSEEIEYELQASVKDDGLPNSDLKIKWSKSKGPGNVDFEDETSPTTLVTFSRSGSYILTLKAEDGEFSHEDTITLHFKEKSQPVTPPIAWWTFDETQGDITTEIIGNTTSKIEGDNAIWGAGVSGSGLVFNGWSSMVSLPVEKSPFLYESFKRDVTVGELSMEAWIAIKAYPWNWCPIIQQSIPGKNGYFFGIDYYGHLGFKAAIGGGWFEVISKEKLPRNKWVHVAATYESKKGMMTIYINGQKAGDLETSGRELFMAANNQTADQLDVRIGKGTPMKPALPIRPFFTDTSEFAFDGIIDEVKIYDTYLGPDQIYKTYAQHKPNDLRRQNPDLQKRVLPGNGLQSKRFGAYYTKLKFYDTWDNRWRVGDHSDLVVQFDELPVQLIFWRGTSYIPHWVSENNIWATQEFTESGTEYGCAEPMSDKESRHSYVRIIENTPARVVLHWRYALVDVKYDSAGVEEPGQWGDWTDEYHVIYPDGVSVRAQHAWSIEPGDREWHEGIILNGPEQRPEDNLEWDAMTLANLLGESHTYSWKDGPPQGEYHGGGMREPKDRNIAVMNLKADWDPFVIGPPSDELILAAYNDPREFTKYSKFSWFNHWPMSYVISDGHHAHTVDRTTSTSMFWLDTVNEFFHLDENLGVKLYLNGMTTKPARELAKRGRSWLQAPEVTKISGAKSLGYDQSQAAYILKDPTSSIKFTLPASDENPLLNPCVLIQGWHDDVLAKMTINGQTIESGTDFRQGVTIATDGTLNKVIWIKFEATKTTNIVISK